MRGLTTVNTKKLAGAATVSAVAAVTTLVLGATPAFAAESEHDSAYALQVSGLLDIDPVSKVESTDGKLVSDELLALGDVAGKYEDDLSFGLLTAEAQANKAESVVKEVNVFDLLRADIIRTHCASAKGGLEIINGSVLGHKLPKTPVPSQDLDVSPLVKLSLNEQKRGTNGSLTVKGIELTVLPSAAGKLDEVLSPEDKKELPLLGKALGKELSGGVNTVRDLVDGIGLPLEADGDLLTVTIGYAHCQAGGASGDNDEADDNGNGKDDGDKDDDGKDDGGKDKDDDGKDKNSDVKSDKAAPAPTVVKAALAVTG